MPDMIARGLSSTTKNKLTSKFGDLPPVPFLLSRVGAVAPTLTTFSGNIQQYSFSVNDEMYGASEVSHLYKDGTDLYPHIHWATNGLDTTDRYVKWELEYCIADDAYSFSSPTVISYEETIPLNTTSLTHFISDFPTIDGSIILGGAYLCWRIRRIASTGTAPTNNPFGLAFGIHVNEDFLK